MDGLSWLNALPAGEARAAFLRCCGSPRWAEAMQCSRPFRDAEELQRAAEQIWKGLGSRDWLEAFSHHPRIGDGAALRARFAGTWSVGEQEGAAGAPGAVLDALAEGNREYEARFDRTFIVCATGRSAAEMLALLRERLANDAETELRIAAEEQARITRIRIDKLLQEAGR
jgi:2-oxo-4-hydroxy-4-carboxy-5-ureidoimidazoline decarboxylase